MSDTPRSRLVVPLTVAVVGGVGFAAVALSVDGAFAVADARAHEALFDAFGRSVELGRAVTWFGNNATLMTLVIGLAVVLAVLRQWGDVARLVLASGGGALVINGLKWAFGRERPLDPVIPAEGLSFPSGHATASTIFYSVLVVLVWRWTENRAIRWSAVVLAPVLFVGVGLSRVYLNVHFLSDVVAGWCTGAAWLGVSLAIVRAVEARSADRAR
ncbi:MAG: phosphatase PAP2 family protein [Bacteroidota bacterium]